VPPAAQRPAIRIRPRGIRDDAFIAKLSAQAFSELSPRAAERTLGLCQRSITLIAERAGEAVGFAALKAQKGGTAELLAIAVVERERGRGVGCRLLCAVERVARDRGSVAVELHTADGNVAALHLFVGAGFALRGRQDRYYRGAYDALRMIKTLAT
jgi:[ribosomal protein S18]-alanine N-acetyltransferase